MTPSGGIDTAADDAPAIAVAISRIAVPGAIAIRRVAVPGAIAIRRVAISGAIAIAVRRVTVV